MKYCGKCGAEVTDRFCPKCGYDCKKDDENINDTINRLYALRAGISYVSEENSIYKSEKNSYQKRYDSLSSKLSNDKNALKSSRKRLNDIKYASGQYSEHKERKLNLKLKKDQDAYVLAKEKQQKYEKLSNIFYYVFDAFLIIFGVLILGGWLIGSIVDEMGGNFEAFVVPLFVAVILGGVIFFIVFLKMKKRRENFEEKVKNLGAENVKNVNEINALRGHRSLIDNSPKTEIQIKTLEESIAKNKLELALVESDLQTKPKPHLILANEVYEALQKEYSVLLDVRDWENLDLVIYYLETGRAESIKEALQQVDRKLQTDSIVSAINTASSQVCNTIRAGISHMNDTIVKCAGVLSLQLENISRKQDSLSNKISDINMSIRQSFNATSMRAALESKADVSSKQLMDDVHQMRIYAENAEIRRRNS